MTAYQKQFSRESALDYLRAHNDGVYKITASKNLDALVTWLLDELQPPQIPATQAYQQVKEALETAERVIESVDTEDGDIAYRKIAEALAALPALMPVEASEISYNAAWEIAWSALEKKYPGHVSPEMCRVMCNALRVAKPVSSPVSLIKFAISLCIWMNGKKTPEAPMVVWGRIGQAMRHAYIDQAKEALEAQGVPYVGIVYFIDP